MECTEIFIGDVDLDCFYRPPTGDITEVLSTIEDILS